MPPRINPLKLNPLQLKTLTLLQELGRLVGTPVPSGAGGGEGEGAEGGGGVMVNQFPHGNHFHMGNAVVSTSDANGLANQAVWVALERKGLIKSMFPNAAIITPAGMEYDTGLTDKILHRSDH
jgi:hypothetical protein